MARKRMIAVLDFEVDEGCEHFTKDNVVHFIDGAILRAHSTDRKHNTEPTYTHVDTALYESFSDILADIEDGDLEVHPTN